jgi:hypothetical protein
MLIVPTQPVLSQSFQVTLDGQQVAMNIYQESYGLFMDVLLAGVPIVTGQICQNGNPIVDSAYLGLDGDLVWYDTMGTGTDPFYTGLGGQYELVFLEAADIAALGIQ